MNRHMIVIDSKSLLLKFREKEKYETVKLIIFYKTKTSIIVGSILWVFYYL